MRSGIPELNLFSLPIFLFVGGGLGVAFAVASALESSWWSIPLSVFFGVSGVGCLVLAIYFATEVSKDLRGGRMRLNGTVLAKSTREEGGMERERHYYYTGVNGIVSKAREESRRGASKMESWRSEEREFDISKRIYRWLQVGDKVAVTY